MVRTRLGPAAGALPDLKGQGGSHERPAGGGGGEHHGYDCQRAAAQGATQGS